MRRFFRVLLLSIVDSFRENLGYHSASLTYQFLTVVGSVVMLLGFASMYLPLLEPARVYQHLKALVPSHAELLLDKLLPVYENRASGSFLSLALAYYFSLSFARSLNVSFGYIYRRKPLESELLFWIYMPLLLVLYTTILSLAVALLALSKSYLGSLYQRLTEVLNFLLLFSILVMLYSSYFRPRRQVLFASAFVALLLLLLNKLFSLIVVKLLSASPLYSLIGSPLAFLVWLYYSFFFLLMGVSLIRKLDEPL